MSSILAILVLLVADVGDSMIRTPAEVKGDVGDFIKVEATTNCKAVKWYAMDGGLAIFPMDLLKDTRTAVVVGKQPGRYRLLAYTAAGDTPSDPAIVLVIVGNAPPPVPPEPGPQPPGPNPPQPPTPAKELRVILVYESAATLTAGQRKALYSGLVEEYLNAKCAGGKAGWRRWDRDIDLTHATEDWKSRWASAKPNVKTVPAVVIFDGNDGKVYDLPDGEDKLLDLLKKAGG